MGPRKIRSHFSWEGTPLHWVPGDPFTTHMINVLHYTAFLGDWVLNADELDRRGADPTMLDLLRWHGAEEVEHRSVAFDLFMHVDGGYRRRARTWATAFAALMFLWQRGSRFFMANDPTLVDAHV